MNAKKRLNKFIQPNCANSDLFKKSNVIFDKLLKYGFEKEDNKYLYSKTILDNTFKVIVEINGTGRVKGKIIELSLNEEYNNFRIENITGQFVNKVRDEFEKILIDIKNNCFSEKYFISNQANRIADLIISKYNNKPEFLWEKYLGYGVFRNSNNDKWYAIIMNILRSKIDEGNDEIEILNVKLNEEKIEKLQNKKGFYKAYHMNKKNWISIILDDTLSDNEIMEYIEESYLLINN